VGEARQTWGLQWGMGQTGGQQGFNEGRERATRGVFALVTPDGRGAQDDEEIQQ
jgi:hypothetical protein